MWHALGVSPADALVVAVASAGSYLVVFLLLRVLGIGLLRGSSPADLPLAVMLGAVAGRATLGYTPTLGAAVVALLVLLALHSGVRAISRGRAGRRLPATAPVLVLAEGAVLPEGLAAARISADEVNAKLRGAGVTGAEDVGVGVLETSGALSVYPRGAVLDRALLQGVRGAEALSGGR